MLDHFFDEEMIEKKKMLTRLSPAAHFQQHADHPDPEIRLLPLVSQISTLQNEVIKDEKLTLIWVRKKMCNRFLINLCLRLFGTHYFGDTLKKEYHDQ